MTNQHDSISRLRVNAANPGEFLACCGLAELADRISCEGVESYFDKECFVLLCTVPVAELLQKLTNIKPVLLENAFSRLQADKKIAPLELPLQDEVTPLRLDAWTRLKVNGRKIALDGDPFWKFWGGHQGVSTIWSDLRSQLKDQLDKKEIGSDPEDLFRRRRFMTGRFGFDPQAAWNALDVGYSPNDQKQPVATSPALELLALVGLQRVRPAILEDFQFEYSTWGKPLTPATAAAAACGVLAAPPFARFRAQIIRRGQYGGLSHATQISGDNT
jgi:CRISPR-associated protein Csb3